MTVHKEVPVHGLAQKFSLTRSLRSPNNLSKFLFLLKHRFFKRLKIIISAIKKVCLRPVTKFIGEAESRKILE